MRRSLASVTDAIATALGGFLGFRLALAVTPCASLTDCAVLTPAIILAVLIALSLYFGAGYLLWHTTPGQRIFRLE
jgi:hypothetical protein